MQLLQSWPLKEFSMLSPLQTGMFYPGVGLQRWLILKKISMAMLSHRIPPSQALFSEDHRKVWGNICHGRFCPSLRWRVQQCQKVAITQSVAPWSPRNGNGGEVAGSMLACVRQPEWKMTRLEEKKRTKLLGFSASLLDVHTVWNRRWP